LLKIIKAARTEKAPKGETKIEELNGTTYTDIIDSHLLLGDLAGR
jgi:hypothetical protein